MGVSREELLQSASPPTPGSKHPHTLKELGEAQDTQGPAKCPECD